MNILVTGVAGFIGMHTVKELLKEGHQIIGIDNVNSYYEPQLKYDRLQDLGIEKAAIEDHITVDGIQNFKFIKVDLKNEKELNKIFKENNFDCVINLAAQAGVRYSISNPRDYVDSNLIGFFNILEACRNYKIKHLIYASSSSVYGHAHKTPFLEADNTDEPISFYAATKKSNEVMAHSYSSLYGFKVTGLRFFTVYGPWGRPDMAPFIFTKAAFENKPISVFNNGKQSRDFTFINDIVAGIRIVVEKSEELEAYSIYNIGKGDPDDLMDFISTIEKHADKEIEKEFKPAQPGDVSITYADVTELNKLGYNPTTDLNTGIEQFIDWYKDYYKIS